MLRRRVALPLAIAVLVAACGSSGPSSAVTTTSTPAASAAIPSESVGVVTGGGDESAAPESQAPESEQPSATEPPVESAEPSAEPSASAAPGAADDCTGTDANRQFFASVAQAVDWTVLCAALPKGWFVSTGSYRLANGGKLIVSYKGPSGATLDLSEGTYCSFPGACVPGGTEIGDAAMGPLTGTMIAIDGGGYAVVVDPGAEQGWLLEAHGIDEATTRDFAAALVEVAG